jgi:hypothetical protein
MIGSMFGWVRAALLGSVVAGLAACGSSGSTDATSSGGSNCTPGEQKACACPGGVEGVQTCAADGRSLEACQCGGSTGSGMGGAGGSSGASTGTKMEPCGDGVQQPGECLPSNETHFYCPADCDGTTASGSSSGTGGSCAGQQHFGGTVPNVTSVWMSGGLTSLAAGDDMCQKLGTDGIDHVCDYEEMLVAQKADEFKAIAAGTTFWVQRSTPAMVNGVMSQPGPGGRCNDWKYNTNHISDGEYVSFDKLGEPTYFLDNDTVFDGANPGVHNIPGMLECNGVSRSIMCCYTKCK